MSLEKDKQPMLEGIVDSTSQKAIPSSEAIERPKGLFDVNLRVTVESEIQWSRIMDQFFVGLVVSGVSPSRIKDVVKADRVIKGADGIEHFEKITQFGPKQ